MHPVYKLNGPIGGEESWCKGFAHPECDREDPESAPSLTQIQCLHFEHACTRCAPDVISQNSCSWRPHSGLQMHPVYKLNGPIGGEESWCKGFAHPECDREDPESAPSLTQIQCLHFEHACTRCAHWRHRPKLMQLEDLIQSFKFIQFAHRTDNRRWGMLDARQGQW